MAFILLLHPGMQGTQQPSGTVRGRVFNAGTMEPLQGVQITLIPMDTDAPPPPAAFAQNTAVSDVSDQGGNFMFSGVRAGRFAVDTRFEGYFLSARRKLITLAAGETIDVPLMMTAGAVIGGRVHDVMGQPVSNVNVEALTVVYRRGFPSLITVGAQATDDRGEYRLFWVPPGDYFIAVSPRPPLRNARGPQNVRTFYPSATNAGAATPLSVKAGEEITDIDIAVRRESLAKISGQVTSTVTPPTPPATAQGAFAVIAQNQARSAEVWIVGRDATIAHDERIRSVTVALGAGGQFELPNVLSGSYDLYALARDRNDSFALTHIPLDVRDQDIADVHIVLQSGVEAKGTVSINGSPAGREMAGILLQPDGTMGMLGLAPTVAPVDAMGAFTAGAVAEGHYRVVVGASSNLYVNEVRQNDIDIYDSGFDVGANSPQPIQIIMKSGTGSVQGSTSAGALVALVPIAHRENHARFRETIANGDGSFVLGGVAPGNYKIFAWDNAPDGAYFNPSFLARYEDFGVVVTVTADSKITLDSRITSR
jgi:hypothetical protein